MIMHSICWSPSRRMYVVDTDRGPFFVPPVQGGWSQRRSPYGWAQGSAVALDRNDCQQPTNPAALAQALGMVSTTAPGQRMGGCQCKGRRP